MSPENQDDHEVVPAARFVETSRSVRLPTDGTGSSIMVAVLRRDLLPSTGNSKLPKNKATIPRANPFASNVYRNHHSLTYAAKAACRAKANTVELAVTYCRGGDCEFVLPPPCEGGGRGGRGGVIFRPRPAGSPRPGTPLYPPS